MPIIVRAEVTFGEAAHRRASAVEEAFVNRDLRRRGAVTVEAVDDARARAKGEQAAMIGESRLRLVTDRQIVGEPRGAADEIDVASNGAGGEIDRVVQNETAARVHFAVAQIKRLGEPDR